MKRFTAIALGLLLCGGTARAQSISPHLIANNAWMSADTYNGEIERLWGWMDDARFQMIRIGGHGALSQVKNLPWLYRTIDSIRAFGAEPLVQVPSDYSETQAADFITAINIQSRKNVKYWSIGNEPDWQSAGGGNDPQGVDLSPAGVVAYTRAIAKGLRSVQSDIVIFAGEFAWYNESYLGALMGSNGVLGKDENGHYYVDGISWHHYDANNLNSSVESEVDRLLARFATVNANRPDKPLSWMIGEYNSNVGNDNVAADLKAWSFVTGQNFALVYDVGMRKGAFTICPWSMHESGGARTNYDLGLFDGSNGNYAGRSSYWHSSMLGQNMRANALSRSDNQASVHVIAMGDANGSSIMLLNKGAQGHDFALRLDEETVQADRALKINVGAGVAMEVTGTLAANSTQMLVFDPAGNLVKRYTYTTADAGSRRGPTVENIQPPVCRTWNAPGRVQAEAYCTQSGTELVDAVGGTDQAVGFVDAGDTVGYRIEVPAAGTYTLDLRAASNVTTGSVDVYVNGAKATDFALPSTGGWNTWQTHSLAVQLPKGSVRLALRFTGPGFNLDWFEFRENTTSVRKWPTSLATQRKQSIFPSYSGGEVDLKGRRIK